MSNQNVQYNLKNLPTFASFYQNTKTSFSMQSLGLGFEFHWFGHWMNILKVAHSVPILHSSVAHYSDFGAQCIVTKLLMLIFCIYHLPYWTKSFIIIEQEHHSAKWWQRAQWTTVAAFWTRQCKSAGVSLILSCSMYE